MRAAIRLLDRGGRSAVTTRAVSAAAGVQPTAIYRQFGDMQGLLDAAARETLAVHMRDQASRPPSDDPVEDLRRGWDLAVSFGLSHPDAFALLNGDSSADKSRSAMREGVAVLQGLVARIAKAGRLRVDVAQAAELLNAAGVGVTLALTAIPPQAGDNRLSETMRELILAAITVPATAESSSEAPDSAPEPDRIAVHAIALRALLAEDHSALSTAERELLVDWLDRLATNEVTWVNLQDREPPAPSSTGH